MLLIKNYLCNFCQKRIYFPSDSIGWWKKISEHFQSYHEEIWTLSNIEGSFDWYWGESVSNPILTFDLDEFNKLFRLE